MSFFSNAADYFKNMDVTEEQLTVLLAKGNIDKFRYFKIVATAMLEVMYEEKNTSIDNMIMIDTIIDTCSTMKDLIQTMDSLGFKQTVNCWNDK